MGSSRSPLGETGTFGSTACCSALKTATPPRCRA
jgi:hypothetical protein